MIVGLALMAGAVGSCAALPQRWIFVFNPKSTFISNTTNLGSWLALLCPVGLLLLVGGFGALLVTRKRGSEQTAGDDRPRE